MNVKEHIALIIAAQEEIVRGVCTLRDELADERAPALVSKRALVSDLEMFQYSAAELLRNLHALAEHASEPMPRVPYTAHELRELAGADPRVGKVLSELASEERQRIAYLEERANPDAFLR
jgi:hypothetical protein